MNNPHFDYWREALQCALEEVGKFEALTSEEYDAAAKVLEGASEQKGMAFGHDAIPNPLTTEIKRQEQIREKERERLEERGRRLEDALLAKYGLSPYQGSVRVEANGQVFIEERMR